MKSKLPCLENHQSASGGSAVGEGNVEFEKLKEVPEGEGKLSEGDPAKKDADASAEESAKPEVTSAATSPRAESGVIGKSDEVSADASPVGDSRDVKVDIAGDGSKAKEMSVIGGEEKEEEEEEEPSGAVGKVVHFISLPIMFVYKYTIPDCRLTKWKSWWPLTFLNSVAWIAVVSYVMVLFASVSGCVLGIHPVVMGLLVVAVGTSVPDTLSSMIVARQGKGGMAAANALGSNIFNNFMCLGIPWTLKILIVNGMKPEPIIADAVMLSTFLLFVTLAIFWILVTVSKWYLNRWNAVVMILTYLAYCAFVIVQQFT